MAEKQLTRNQVYGIALRKLELAQRLTGPERRELRRHRLADGSYRLPVTQEDVRILPGIRLADPRLR
jgi:hypothetical protein